MKVNGILYKLLEVVEESRRSGILQKPLVEKLLHVPEQMELVTDERVVDDDEVGQVGHGVAGSGSRCELP